MPLSIVRHQSIFDPNDFKSQKITIIGAGATGSRVFASLVDLGITNIDVLDFDTVESHNLANQIYLSKHIGLSKVEALKDYYYIKTGSYAPDTMRFFNERVTGISGIEPFSFVYLLTDTMSSRKWITESIFESIDLKEIGPIAIVETRMGPNYGELYFFDPWSIKDREEWTATLFDDDDYPDVVSPCGTSISVGPTANLIANAAVWQMINMLQNNKFTLPPQQIYTSPNVTLIG